MNLLGRIAGLYVPPYLKKRGLRTLFEMTASAFGADIPRLVGLSYNECLVRYAQFTNNVVEKSIDNLYNLGVARQQLCHQAFDLGNTFREQFSVSSTSDVMAACRVIYGCIGIDFRGTDEGEITIRKCFFSSYYSEQACGIISCLDKGLVGGLSHGGKLRFVQRITEGMDCCKAEFILQENNCEISDRGGHRCRWCDCC